MQEPWMVMDLYCPFDALNFEPKSGSNLNTVFNKLQLVPLHELRNSLFIG